MKKLAKMSSEGFKNAGFTSNEYTVCSASVCALVYPPWAERYLSKAFSSGYFSDPMKIMCSRKCAANAIVRVRAYSAPGLETHS